MTEPKFYLDEDTQSEALIQALRSRGVSLLTTSEAGRSKQGDEEQLRFAATQGRVLLTSNIADFVACTPSGSRQVRVIAESSLFASKNGDPVNWQGESSACSRNALAETCAIASNF